MLLRRCWRGCWDGGSGGGGTTPLVHDGRVVNPDDGQLVDLDHKVLRRIAEKFGQHAAAEIEITYGPLAELVAEAESRASRNPARGVRE